MGRCSRFFIAGLLLGVVWPATASAAEVRPVVVANFEQAADADIVSSRKGAVISGDISSRGRSSLRVRAGDVLNIRTSRLGSARRGDLLRIDFFNAGAAPQQVRAEIFDAVARKSYWHRHVRQYALRPGWNTLSFRVARLYRGEKNTRKITDSYLEPARIDRIDLAFDPSDEPAFIYIDNVRFEPDPPMPKAAGLLAFDFGPENQAPRRGFVACSRETYDDARGHGWSGPGWPKAVRDYTHPNDLLSDFREAQGETFSVRVPDGAYHVRVYYEDHGWWSDQMARFDWRTIKAEGKEVHAERPDGAEASKLFYRFADVEPRPATNVYETYIKNGRYRPREFDVDVKDGRLDIRFDADRSWACRISAIVLWPEASAEAAAEWCAELDRRLHEEFDAEYVYIDAAPRGRHIARLPEAARPGGLVVFSAGGTKPTAPGYVPDAAEVLTKLSLVCVSGEDTGAAFGLRSARSGQVKVTAAIADLGCTISLVQNRIKRRGGGYTIVPDIIRPLGDLALTAAETRQLWLEIAVPPDTRPGRYAGEIAVEFGEHKRAIPVTVDVLAITLSEPRMAFGLFGLLPDWHAPPGALKQVIGLFRRHGLSSVSGVPLGRAIARNGKLEVDFRRADTVMALLKEAGFKLRVDTYGVGLLGIGPAAKELGLPYDAARKQAMDQLREHAKAAEWLPVSYSLVDEPQWSEEAVADATDDVLRFREAAPWLMTNGYWNPDAGNRAHRALIDALDRTSLVRITSDAVRYLKAEGKSMAFYSTCSRQAFGFEQWAAAAGGFDAHYAWHSYIRYGDLYYDLDGREPDVCMVYYTPTDVRPSLRLKAVRRGAYDFRYLQTLADALKTAAPDAPGARGAKALLDKARAAGNLYRKRSAPKIADPDAFRMQVARAILKLK